MSSFDIEFAAVTDIGKIREKTKTMYPSLPTWGLVL